MGVKDENALKSIISTRLRHVMKLKNNLKANESEFNYYCCNYSSFKIIVYFPLQMLRVGRHENIFILFLMAIKTAGSAQKVRVGRVSGNTAIFCLCLI